MRKSLSVLIIIIILFSFSCTQKQQKEETAKPVEEINYTELEDKELLNEPGLQITYYQPAGRIYEDAPHIVVTFSKDIIPLSDNKKFNKWEYMDINPSIRGSFNWKGTRTLEFEPEQKLDVNREYKITIKKGLTTVSGSDTLKEDFEFSFVNKGFKVLGIYKDINSRGLNSQYVSVRNPVYLKMNYPVSSAGLDTCIKFSDSQGELIPISTEVDKNLPDMVMIKPVTELEYAGNYSITVLKCIASDYGNSGLQSDYTYKFRTENKFRVVEVETDKIRPNENIELRFSNPVDTGAKKFIHMIADDDTINGEDMHMWGNYYSDNRYFISASFKPRTEYNFTIDKEFYDINGNMLNRDYSKSINIGDYEPRISINGKGFLLENYLKGYIPVKSVNNGKTFVKISRMTDEGYYTNVFSGKVPVNTEENVYQTVPLKFKELVKNRNGFYKMTMSPPDKTMFVNLTEMAVMAKMDFEGTHVFVYSLKTGKPVKNAEVFYDVLSKSRTDSEGYAYISGRNSLKDITLGNDKRLFVKSGKDECVMVLNGEWSSDYPYNKYSSPYFVGHWSYNYYTNKVFTYSDRGLYKPGEVVWLKVIYRQYDDDRVKVPDGSLQLKIRNSRNEVIKDQEIYFNEMGTAVVACSLAQNAPTGNYYVNVGNKDFTSYADFRVEEFKPLEFSVELVPSHQHLTMQDMPAVNVTGKYMYGAMMNGDSLYWYINARPYSFVPKGYRDYNFSYSGGYYDYEYDDYYYGGADRLGEGKGVFEAGNYLINVKPALSKYASPVMLTYMVRSKSASGQEISKSVNMIYHPSDIYIGVKSSSYVYNVSENPMLEMVCVNKDGQKRNSGNIKLCLIQEKYVSVKKAGTGGRTYWENELVEDTVYEKGINIRNGSETTVIDRKLDSGYYKVLLTYKTGENEHRVNTWFYKVGSGDCWWGMRNDNTIDLVPDRQDGEYKPGDKANILIKSPVKDCKAVISIERGLVYETFMVDIKSNAQMITIPIKEEYLPNIIVSAYVFKGRDSEKIEEDSIDVGIPKFGIGYCNLKVSSQSKKLDVSISTDHDNYEPQDSVEVTIDLKGYNGEPVRGELSVAVVDLGVLNLIGYETPEPLSFFYSRMPHFVNTFTNAGEVVGQRNYGEKGENRGGGGAEERFRAEFLSLAYYNGKVKTDADGRAVIKFKLPDNLTTFRIMAVACTEDRFGSNEKDFTVSKKFMLTPSLPNFVRPGDKLDCGVVAVNMTGDGARVNVTCDVDGANIEGNKVNENVLAVNSNKEILYTMTVPEYRDSVTFTFKGNAGMYKDNLRINIPCIMPPLMYASALAENTDAASAEHYVQKPDMIDGTGVLSVSLSSTGLNDVKEATKYLFGYPYGCLEQQTSRVLPLIIGKELVEVFDLSEIKGKKLKDIMTAYLADLYKYQQYDGGFYIWPERTGYSSPYLTCYVMMVCSYAEDEGYKIDSKVKKSALDYLKKIASGQRTGPFYTYYSEKATLTTRLFAMMVLKMNNEKVATDINNIVNDIENMNIEALSYLSYIIAGNDKYSSVEKRVIERINQKTMIESRYAHIESDYDYWIYGSNVKNTALGLWTSLNIFNEDSENAEKFIYWILRARKNNRWSSTQENAFVLMAVDRYFEVFENVEPDFTAEVAVDGREMMKQAFEGYSTDIISDRMNLDEIKKDKFKVEFTKNGQGRLYYQMMLQFSPKTIEYRDNGFAVSKKIEPVKDNVRGYVRGELYKVTLKVNTQADRLYVVVDDPLPAGFEIVNTAFKTNEGLTDGTGGGYSWFGGFNHTEKYFDRMLLFSDYLSKGEHEYSYIVRATYAGRFNMPATKAEEMYTPEVYGNTPSAVIDIR